MFRKKKELVVPSFYFVTFVIRRENEKRFYVIELLVVVLIIGILAAVALPQYTKAVEKSRATEAITLLGNLLNAEQIYKMSTGAYTSDMTLLDLQMPGITGTSAVSSTNTKNFLLAITTANTTNFAASATRMTSAGTVATGDLAYVLNVSIDQNGNISRTCTGTTAAATCKSITNGETCSDTGNNSTWCYSTSTTSGGAHSGGLP